MGDAVSLYVRKAPKRIRDDVCAGCSADFIVTSPSQRYCSTECQRWTSHIRRVDDLIAQGKTHVDIERIACPICSIVFWSANGSPGCSSQCSSAWNAIQAGRVSSAIIWWSCTVCAASGWLSPAAAKQRVFCSPECRESAAAQMGRISHSVGAWRLMSRDGFRCAYCGLSPLRNENVELHVEHVVAVSRGGGDNAANLITACAFCNLSKNDDRLGLELEKEILSIVADRNEAHGVNPDAKLTNASARRLGRTASDSESQSASSAQGGSNV